MKTYIVTEAQIIKLIKIGWSLSAEGYNAEYPEIESDDLKDIMIEEMNEILPFLTEAE